MPSACTAGASFSAGTPPTAPAAPCRSRIAARLAALGVPAFACTPDLFPDLMAATIRKGDLIRWAASVGIAAVAADG